MNAKPMEIYKTVTLSFMKEFIESFMGGSDFI